MGLAGAAIAAGVVGSVAGAAISSGAATDAANIQAGAQMQAAQLQKQEFDRIQKMLLPYNTGGQRAFGQLQRLTGSGPGGNPLKAALTKPFQPTMAQLSRTPGYQFALQQGTQATQNSFAAQGLGQSGAALKGAANYAEGLASTTYQQAGLGENAAAQAGNTGAQITSNIGNAITGAAAARAGGIVGSANALGAGINGVSNAGLLYAIGNNSGLFGTPSASNGATSDLNAATDEGAFL